MQAFRKLLCDVLLECKARPSHALPAFAAAADAWPGGLPPAASSDAADLWSAAADTAGRDHSDCGVALMHSIASRLCACQSASARCPLRSPMPYATYTADEFSRDRIAQEVALSRPLAEAESEEGNSPP